MLARTVLGQRGRGQALTDPAFALDLAVGAVRRVLQVGFTEPGAGEDPADPVEVERLAGVAGTDQGEEFVGQIESGTHHGQSLDRLVGRPREDRGARITDRLQDRAVGIGHGDGAMVHGLDEASAHHLSEDSSRGENGRDVQVARIGQVSGHGDEGSENTKPDEPRWVRPVCRGSAAKG